jgi:hypothetical protein
MGSLSHCRAELGVRDNKRARGVGVKGERACVGVNMCMLSGLTSRGEGIGERGVVEGHHLDGVVTAQALETTLSKAAAQETPTVPTNTSPMPCERGAQVGSRNGERALLEGTKRQRVVEHLFLNAVRMM